MKTRKPWSVCSALVTLISAWAVAGSQAGAQPVTGTLRAGADVRPVCTLSGVPLAGYGGLPRRKTIPSADGYTFFFNPDQGTHDDVRVKTLVLEVQSNPPFLFAFVSLDAIGYSPNITPAVENLIQGTGLDRHNIMFMASHTHSGAGAASDKIFWQIAAADVLNQDVFDHMVNNIVDSIAAALSNLQAARLGIGVGYENTITENRRHALGPVDARVGVIKVTTEQGDPLGVLFNFAVHGTCLGGSNMLVSADNMGYAERYLETNLSGVVPLFANAAEGDVKPVQGDWSGAQLVGETLAAKVVDIWQNTTADPETTIEVKTATVTLPQLDVNIAACDETLQALFPVWSQTLPGPIADTEELFMAVRLNTDALVTVPGEAITNLGLQIQSDLDPMGWDHVFIMGLANGYMGYIVTPQEYDLGGYEVCGTLHGRDTAVFVRNTVVGVGQQLTPPEGPGPDASVPDAAVGADGALEDAAMSWDASGQPDDGGLIGPAADKGCGCAASPSEAQGAFLPILAALLGLLAVSLRLRRRRGGCAGRIR